ncbi:hypothetical protein [Sinomonas soli]
MTHAFQPPPADSGPSVPECSRPDWSPTERGTVSSLEEHFPRFGVLVVGLLGEPFRVADGAEGEDADLARVGLVGFVERVAGLAGAGACGGGVVDVGSPFRLELADFDEGASGKSALISAAMQWNSSSSSSVPAQAAWMRSRLVCPDG